jgi:predicted DNA-binding transcriptional regulator YafY
MSKSRILYVQKFLEEYTDEEHQVTLADISEYLKSQGIESSPKTLLRDIEELEEIGVDIVCNKGKPHKFFIGIRNFELAEIKLLIDTVKSARFIPTNRQKNLIEKISYFASEHQRESLEPTLISDCNPIEMGVYNTIEILNIAIKTKKKVTFKYRDWTPQGKKIYKHNGQNYVFRPYGTIYDDNRHYVVGFCESHKNIATFRVDRMCKTTLSKLTAEPKPKNFSFPHYRKVFQMFDGKECDVTLKCKNGLMVNVIDRFGEKLKSEIVDDEYFSVKVNTVPSPNFFSWVFSFNGRMCIITPEEVKKEYTKMLENALKTEC